MFYSGLIASFRMYSHGWKVDSSPHLVFAGKSCLQKLKANDIADCCLVENPSEKWNSHSNRLN